MAENTLEETIRVLLIYYKININPELTAADLFINGYFAKFEVCAASVNYWFRFFNEQPSYLELKSYEIIVRPEDRLKIVCTLLKNNPSWTIYHIVDAVKVCKRTVQKYIRDLGLIHSSQGWIQIHSMSH